MENDAIQELFNKTFEELGRKGVINFYQAKFLSLVCQEIQHTGIKNLKPYRNIYASKPDDIALLLVAQFLRKHKMDLTFNTAQFEIKDIFMESDPSILDDLKINDNSNAIHSLYSVWKTTKDEAIKTNKKKLRQEISQKLNSLDIKFINASSDSFSGIYSMPIFNDSSNESIDVKNPLNPSNMSFNFYPDEKTPNNSLERPSIDSPEKSHHESTNKNLIPNPENKNDVSLLSFEDPSLFSFDDLEMTSSITKNDSSELDNQQLISQIFSNETKDEINLDISSETDESTDKVKLTSTVIIPIKSASNAFSQLENNGVITQVSTINKPTKSDSSSSSIDLTFESNVPYQEREIFDLDLSKERKNKKTKVSKTVLTDSDEFDDL
ncbi:hypothetical protein TRFO_09691 [Tritrichomonas foetus]|uniref:Uncharacterized protein n=1 Tax=Tritrichomonas foetus TaxID=1144522 RepID=A0A1J4JHY7_9EUKA|nr:hypothetical protein TRFO_09691 [Tritrichomonas foetus]|eukprot:OHS97117.1 hypothetical protein TRFO_09691 [Tritrichomonas foetus]